MKLRLYHYWRSSSSWRVRWAFALKKIKCELVAVDLLSDETDRPEHRGRNPMGYVPVLEFLDAPAKSQGPRYLAESMAIVEWAEERFPSPTLLPGTPEERARIRHLAELVNSGIQPLLNPNVTAFHSEDRALQKSWCQNWIRKGLGSYETLVKETAGEFSFGDEITLADVYLIPQCFAALRFDVDLGEFPTVKRIYERALQTEACAASAPDRYKPAG